MLELIWKYRNLSILKSVYFNFYYFQVKTAIKFPVFISRNVRLSKVHGSINIIGDIRTGMIKIGFGHVGIFDNKRSRSIWEVSGNIDFNGNADFGHGSKISVSGHLNIGSNFLISAETAIVCVEEIRFGNDCVISWDVLIMDGDFHKIKSKDRQINNPKPILIGNKVWICCRCLILKGSIIPDNCVIAANTSVSGALINQNSLYGGNPIRLFKSDIEWES